MKAKTQLQTQHHPRAILGQIHEYISGNGFFFTKQEIGNFFLSLKTKPFVILAGISGTGKTQLPRQFAAAIGAKANCCLIPVRPDWTWLADRFGGVLLRYSAGPRQVAGQFGGGVVDAVVVGLQRQLGLFPEGLAGVVGLRGVLGREMFGHRHPSSAVPDSSERNSER